MTSKYIIEPSEKGLRVLDPWGEYFVDLFPTREGAERETEGCEKEEEIWESAKLLVNNAIETHLRMHNVDRESAAYWINSALGGR